MVGQLLMNLLQVSQTTGESENILDSTDRVKLKVYQWNKYQANSGNGAVYHVLSTTGNRDKSGSSKVDDIQVQLTFWHTDSFEAATYAENVRTVLEGWQGTYNSKTYYKTIFENQVETFEPDSLMPGVVQTWTFSLAR